LLLLKAGAREGRVETYWDAGEVAAEGLRNPFTGAPEEAAEQTEALLRQSLKGQMMADVPLGAFLSGGIDSSTVVALMQAMSNRPVRTFSIGFREPGYDEAPHAREVARHLGTDHTELYVTMKEAMAVVPQLPSLYSEPFADVSQIPTFLVSELARRHVTVALSGDGGDELFSGYTRYRIGDRLWRNLSKVPLSARRSTAALLRSVPAQRWDKVLGLPLRLFPERTRPRLVGDKLNKAAGIIGLSGPDAIYEALTSLWANPAEVVIGASAPAMPQSSVDLAEPVRRMMHQDLIGYLPDDILVKVDRASMAVGLEARVPLLDHRLVAFTWRLPLAYLRREGRAKWPLRQILNRHVPTSLTERPKMGFGVPIDSWLRGGLRDWAESLLDARRLSEEGLFRPEPIRAAWQAHLSGHRNLQYQLWSVLMFQAWNEERCAARAMAPRRVMAAASVGV
jgi:asparagine synthase (glutamine-hydrolysing)